MEGRSENGGFRVRVVPAQVRTAQQGQQDEQDHRQDTHGHQKSPEEPPFGGFLPGQLQINDFQFLGNGFQVVGFRRGQGLAQQGADGGVQHLRKGDEHIRIRHRQAVFPLGHGLPDHVQFHGQFLLRKSLGLAQIFDVFIQHGQNLLAMALS